MRAALAHRVHDPPTQEVALMPNASAAMRKVHAPDEHRVARAIFFKADHPRFIDRFIDYFGSPLTTSGPNLRGQTAVVAIGSPRRASASRPRGGGQRRQPRFSSRTIT